MLRSRWVVYEYICKDPGTKTCLTERTNPQVSVYLHIESKYVNNNGFLTPTQGQGGALICWLSVENSRIILEYELTVVFWRVNTTGNKRYYSEFIITWQMGIHLTDSNQDSHLLLALLLRLENDILLNSDAGELSALILLVCSAAFSVIDHEILI